MKFPSLLLAATHTPFTSPSHLIIHYYYYTHIPPSQFTSLFLSPSSHTNTHTQNLLLHTLMAGATTSLCTWFVAACMFNRDNDSPMLPSSTNRRRRRFLSNCRAQLATSVVPGSSDIGAYNSLCYSRCLFPDNLFPSISRDVSRCKPIHSAPRSGIYNYFLLLFCYCYVCFVF